MPQKNKKMYTVPMRTTVSPRDVLVCKAPQELNNMHFGFYCPFCYNCKSERHKNYRASVTQRENGKYSHIKRLEEHILKKHQEDIQNIQYNCPYASKCGFRNIKTCAHWIEHLQQLEHSTVDISPLAK